VDIKRPVVTLITDFGTADGYVGAMKGVLVSICPQVLPVDITHDIPRHDVYRAAISLLNAAPLFPAGTTHLVVVDPGVGTMRRPLGVRAGGMTYVGPDNGVLSLVLRGQSAPKVVALEKEAYHHSPRWGAAASHTFHGRDIFAPAAAYLAAGVPLTELGPQLTDWTSLSLPTPSLRSPHELVGEVLYLDRFGNAVTNIRVLEWTGQDLRLTPAFSRSEDAPITLSGAAVVACREHLLPLHRTYGEVSPGAPLALVGSSGRLEIAVREDSAGVCLGLRPGDPVILTGRRRN
jgi:S-adenosylmethionine hydrolase